MATDPSSSPGARADTGQDVEAWAASGAMALTGRADGPGLGPPAPLVGRLAEVTGRIADRSRQLGEPVHLDGPAVLAERAAESGSTRAGERSCGGASRLVPTADGWLAVTLARPDDIASVAAWLELDAEPAGDPWSIVAGALRGRRCAPVAERAWLLGLPVAVLDEAHAPDPSDPGPGVVAERLAGPAVEPIAMGDIVVADLSSLWAGPLCGRVLRRAGARVLKVESTGRPDGSRRGPSSFFDAMNAGKLGVSVELDSREGVSALQRLLAAADVVIEASRPRALEQLGVDVASLAAAGGPRVWISITGHGRAGPERDRVAFGDDAAVAGGLVVRDGRGPCFCADAVADPLAGLEAAAACLDALASPDRWLLDVSMSRVARRFAGPTLPVPAGVRAEPPEMPASVGHGPAVGEHDAAVWPELGATA